MKKKLAYSTWAVLYIICAALGFVEEPEGFGKFLLTATGIIFFLPPFYLLLCARQERDQKTVRLLRLISICILCLSLVLIVLNFLSVYFDAYTGLFLHVLLVLFTDHTSLKTVTLRAGGFTAGAAAVAVVCRQEYGGRSRTPIFFSVS